MKSGICPKCQSDQVYVADRAYDEGGLLRFSPFSAARKQFYICRECGYVESYLDPKDLKKVEMKCERVKKRTGL